MQESFSILIRKPTGVFNFFSHDKWLVFVVKDASSTFGYLIFGCNNLKYS